MLWWSSGSASAATTERSNTRGDCVSDGTPVGARPLRCVSSEIASSTADGVSSSSSTSAAVASARRTSCSVRSV